MNKGILVGSASLLVLGVAMTAMAQVATSTEATTPEVVTEETSAPVAEEATEPAAESAGAEQPTEAVEGPAVASTTPEMTPMIESEPVAVSSVEGISSLEDSYFGQHNKYLQILPGNALPDYESGTVAEKLGATIPADARVDVYEAPGGKGYQITYVEEGTAYTVGFGPEADSRTHSYALPLSATSTASSTSENVAQ